MVNFRKAINILVLVSYVKMLLVSSFASETIVTHQTSGSQPTVLHLKPLSDHPSASLNILNTDPNRSAAPVDFKLKAKRSEARLSETGGLEPGVKIKLQRNESQDGQPRKTTAFKIFMADNTPFSQGFMNQLNLVPQIDPDLGVIGVRWKAQDFPDLNFLILRDASLVISGNHSTTQSLKFSTAANIRLENLTANALSLKANSLDLKQKISLNQAQIKLTTPQSKALIEEGANISIPQLSVRRGRLINQGTLRSIGHQNLDIHAGAVFENQSQMAANIKTTLSGNGLLINPGRMVSPIVEGRMGAIDSRGAIEGERIDLIATNTLFNGGVIHGRETTLLTSLTGFIENRGKIIGELFYRLSAAGRIDNSGSIAGEKGRLLSLKESVINHGTLVNAHIQADGLRNAPTGRILKAESIQVNQGENLGYLEAGTLTVNQGTFGNRGNAALESLRGTGGFQNYGQLQFLGTAQQRAILGIRSFTNLSELSEQAVVQGDYLTISSQVHRFLLDSGKWAINDLVIEAGAKSAVCRNKGEFIVANLILHQTGFDNYGQAFIGKLTGTSRSLENHGDFRVKKRTRLPQAQMKNYGFLEFNNKATLLKVDNHQDFIALKGLDVGGWINRGQAEIKRIFSVYTFKNFGEMQLANATIKTDGLQFENQGTLFLIKTVFETAPGFLLTLTNHKTLSVEGGMQGISKLINHNLIELEPGSYSFANLETRQNSQIKLYGPQWTIATSQPSGGEASIIAENFNNEGKISAEQTLIYDTGHAHEGTWEAEKLIYKQAGKILTPESLVGLNASHLEVETEHFEVRQATEILIPHLILRLNGQFHINKDLTAQALEAYVQGLFQCGALHDPQLVQLRTMGPLILHAANIYSRCGKIFGGGKTWLRARSTSVGNPNVLTGIKCEDPKFNGSYIASGSDLTIQGNLHAFWGHVVSNGDLFFEKLDPTQNNTVSNGSGRIQSVKNIYFKDVGYSSHPTNGSPGITRNMSPLLQAGGDIDFDSPNVSNVGGEILAGRNIFHQKRLVAAEGKPFDGSFKNEAFSKLLARVMAGRTFSVNTGDVQLTGTTSAFVVSFNSNSFMARHVGKGQRRPTYDNHIFVDLVELSKQFYGSEGFIKALPNGCVTTDVPLAGGIVPTMQQRLYTSYEPSASIPSFIMDPLQKFMIDPLPFSFILQRALADHVGKLNIEGRSGDDLIRYLFQNAEELRQHYTSGRISKKDLQKTKKALIAYEVRPVEEQLMLAATLVVPKENINPFQDSGDISADTTVNIKTTQNQTHMGNRVRGFKGVHAQSQGSLNATSTVATTITRSGDTTVTTDHIEGQQGFYAEEGPITLGGDKGVTMTGSEIQAKDGVTFESTEGDIQELPIKLQTKVEEVQRSKKRRVIGSRKRTTIHTRVHNTIVPTKVITDGSINYRLGNQAAKVNLEGAQNIAQDIIFDGGQAEISAALAYDTSETFSSTKKTFSRQWKYEHSKTPIATQALLLAAGKVHFTKNTTKATLTGAVVQAPTLINETSEGLIAEPAIGLATYYSRQFQGNKMVNVRITQDVGQEIMIPTVLNVDEIITTHSQLKLISAKLLENTTIHGVYEQSVHHLKSWNNTTVKARQIPAGVIAVVALATAIVTGGAGATLAGTIGFTGSGASMFTAGFTALCSQISTTLVATGGDLESTMKSVASRKSLMSLAASMVTAGVLNEFGIATPTGEKATLGNVAKYAASKAAVESTVNVAFGQQSFEEALKSAGLSIVMTTTSVYGASQIGKAYSSFNPDGTPKLDGAAISPITHKVLHGLLGGAIGAVRGDAIAGAIGGVASECLAEFLKEDTDAVSARVFQKAQDQGIDPQSPKFEDLVRQEIKSTVDWSKMGAAVATLLAGRDVNVGIETATNALENNFLPLIVLAVQGVNMAMMAYDAWEAYEEEGWKGAGKSLAADAAMNAATGGAAKIIGKTAKASWKGLRNLGSNSVKGSDIGLTWGKGIQKQGMPWEDHVAKSLPESARLPQNFKTFDFFDKNTGIAISAKTLNTQTASKLLNPKGIYYSMKKSIDSAADFTSARLLGKHLDAEMITQRIVTIAIPASTKSNQLVEVFRAIDYAKTKNVIVEITKVQ